MSPQLPIVDPDRLGRWCLRHLGSPPVAEIFRSGHLAVVVGVRLADGREVVVKVRPEAPRIAGCVQVQRRLFDAGYPCPEPLSGAEPFGPALATAEAYVPGGAPLPSAGRAAWAFAGAFARLVSLAPPVAEVAALDPPPSWADWNHSGAGLWPRSEDDGIDLDSGAGPEWLDEAGRRARDRMRAGIGAADAVIGHCDWLAGNLRWAGDDLLVVHDWDSVVADSEAVLAGFAAALFSTGNEDALATVEETHDFLTAYRDAHGRALTGDDLERAWAAGLWTRAYDARCEHAAGQPIRALTEGEARERLRRAGIG